VTLTGTAAGTGSPAFSATTNGPGNFVYIASGTGCTVGRYEILSQSSGTATFDHAVGTATDVCTGTIGGSMATPGATGTAMVTQNSMFIQTGTYVITATIQTPGPTHYIEGYGTNHYDGGTKPVLTTSTNSTKFWSVCTSAGGAGTVTFYNIQMSNTAVTPSVGLYNFGGLQSVTLSNLTMIGFTTHMIANVDYIGDLHVWNCEFNTGTVAINTNITSSNQVGNISIYGSYIHGFTSTTGAVQAYNTSIVTIAFSVLANNVVAVGNVAYQVNLINTDVYANTGSAILPGVIVNCVNSIFYGNSGASTTVLNPIGQSTQTPICGTGRNNAFGGNTKNYPTGSIPSFGEITLTASPFTSSTNFTLNSTSGGGALLKKAGFVPTVVGSTATATMDVGAIQGAVAAPAISVGSAFVQ
jgi:hypothetical protein